MQIRENTIERKLRLGVMAHGAKCLKLRHLRGWPDRLILWPNGRTHYVELKKPRGSRFEPLQQRTIKWLKEHRFQVFVIKDSCQVKAYLLRFSKLYGCTPQPTRRA